MIRSGGINLSKLEARVKVLFGEFDIFFDTMEDLETILQNVDIPKIIDKLNQRFGAIIKKEPRKPKPEFEEIYRFTDEGIAELFVSTETNVENIGLSLFAYDPIPASTEQIIRSSGVEDPDALIRQPQYKKYFIKSSGYYLLSREGKKWVREEITPTLTTKQHESQQ